MPAPPSLQRGSGLISLGVSDAAAGSEPKPDLIFFPSLLQIDVTYNVPDPVAKPAFQLLVNLKEPKSERHQQTQHPLRSLSPDKNRSEASHRERALVDDDDPASDQDHQEYKVILETCTR